MSETEPLLSYLAKPIAESSERAVENTKSKTTAPAILYPGAIFVGFRVGLIAAETILDYWHGRPAKTYEEALHQVQASPIWWEWIAPTLILGPAAFTTPWTYAGGLAGGAYTALAPKDAPLRQQGIGIGAAVLTAIGYAMKTKE